MLRHAFALFVQADESRVWIFLQMISRPARFYVGQAPNDHILTLDFNPQAEAFSMQVFDVLLHAGIAVSCCWTKHTEFTAWYSGDSRPRGS